MRCVALVLCICVAACGKQKDTAVEQFMNKDFAPAHARILDARSAYKDIGLNDIDQPGKRAFLLFRVEKVALPLLEMAHDELQTLNPPSAAKAFVATTLELVNAERDALRRMHDALSGTAPAETFKSARHSLASLAPRVSQWTRARDQVVSKARVKLAPLARAPIPEQQPAADAGAMVSPGP
jgi:hypothetical protein